MSALCTLLAWVSLAAGPVEFASPGFPASKMDAEGRLVEDWGPVGVQLRGDGLNEAPFQVAAIQLDDLVPAAQVTADRGAVRLSCTAFRAPIHPAGVDVLCVRLEEARGAPAEMTLALALPPAAKVGSRTVRVGGRVVLALPEEVASEQSARDWGSCDDSNAQKGWAKPEGPCDPAFRNIRAGMGGVPIVYRFSVKPKSAANVVLGFCESHWTEAGQRPLLCRVEGAAEQTVDPVGQWGRHRPGALLFAARDANGDGRLELSVRTATDARDRNPILNAIWIFPAGDAPDLTKVIAGQLNAAADRYVDVGGDSDQSLYPPGKAEYQVRLAPNEVREWVFLVGCHRGAAPLPDTTAWTPQTLRRAARDVWRDWPQP